MHLNSNLEDFFGYSILNEFEGFTVDELIIQATQVSMVWMFLHEESQGKLEEMMVQVEIIRP